MSPPLPRLKAVPCRWAGVLNKDGGRKKRQRILGWARNLPRFPEGFPRRLALESPRKGEATPFVNSGFQPGPALAGQCFPARFQVTGTPPPPPTPMIKVRLLSPIYPDLFCANVSYAQGKTLASSGTINSNSVTEITHSSQIASFCRVL